MKLVLCSVFFPISVGTYLLRAARRMGLDVVTVGPLTSNVIPWDSGLVVPDSMVVETDVRPTDVEKVCEVAAESDLWIDVDGGAFLAFDLPTKRRALLATDPHVWTYGGCRPYVDVCVTMQAGYRERPGDPWVPYGYDPEWHTMSPSPSVEDHDVTLLGAPYPDRVKLAGLLRDRGLRVLGPGRSHVGREYADQLCRAPIALVWPLANDLPARVFEALACNRATICPNVSGLDYLRHCEPDPERTGYSKIVHLGPGLTTTGPVRDLGAVAGIVVDIIEMGGLVGEARRCAGPLGLCPGETWDARLAQLIEVTQ